MYLFELQTGTEVQSRGSEEVCSHEIGCVGEAGAAGQQTCPGHRPPGTPATLPPGLKGDRIKI